MATRSRSDACLAPLGLTGAETTALDGMSTVVKVPAGTVLCRQGARVRQLAWIIDGAADVVRSGDVIARVGMRDVVGEGTMLGAHDTCSADVVAGTPMTLAVMSEHEWRIAARRSPSLVTRLFEVALAREPHLVA